MSSDSDVAGAQGASSTGAEGASSKAAEGASTKHPSLSDAAARPAIDVDPPAAASGPGGQTDGASTTTPESAIGADEREQLRNELADARERADRYHSNWQRSAADFQNWKRRADQEKADATRVAEAALTAELLRVLDDFERAFQSLPPELHSLTWAEGVAMIGQKLFSVLHSRGLRPIDALGQDFDPHLHEAVMRDEEGGPEEQTAVVAELQRGYRYHDRVIRATLVKVGKPPSAASSDPDAAAADVEGASS